MKEHGLRLWALLIIVMMGCLGWWAVVLTAPVWLLALLVGGEV